MMTAGRLHAIESMTNRAQDGLVKEHALELAREVRRLRGVLQDMLKRDWIDSRVVRVVYEALREPDLGRPDIACRGCDGPTGGGAEAPKESPEIPTERHEEEVGRQLRTLAGKDGGLDDIKGGASRGTSGGGGTSGGDPTSIHGNSAPCP